MKPRSKNHRLLPFFVLPLSACVAVPTIASATETTITYANPAPSTPTLDSTAGNANLTIAGTFTVGEMIRMTGTTALTNPFGLTATNYYVVATGAGTIQVASTPGGTALAAVNTTTGSPATPFQSWQAASTWTGGVPPNDTNLADGDNVIASLAGTLPSGLQGLSVSGNATIGGIKFSATGNSDITITGGGNGTAFGTLTFATSAGDPTIPYIEHASGTTRLMNFGGNGTVRFAGTQGLLVRGLAGGALTGTGLDATSTVPAKNIRFQSVDWTSFSGGVTVQRGELGAQAGNQLGSGATAQNLTVGDAQTLTNNLLAGFQFGAGGQAVGTLNGNALGRIWASNDTLTVGTNNATGGNYAGSIGKDFTGASTDTDLTKTGTGTQTISGVITGSGTVNANGTSGTLALSGNNTFTGGATLTAGTLALAHAGAIGTNNLTVGGNGTFDNTSGTPISLTGGLLMTGGSPTFTGTSPVTFNGASTIGNGVTRTVTVTGGTLTIAGILSEPVNASSSSLSKSGAGTLVLSSANTYTGLTTINTDGILKIGNAGSLGGSTVNASVTTTDTSTSATVLAVSNLLVGQLVTGTNIPANTTITAIDVPTLTITLSQAATGSGTNPATFGGMTDINSGGTLDLNGQIISESFNGLDGAGAGGIGAIINSNTGSPAEITTDLTNLGNFTVGGEGHITLHRVNRNAVRTVTKIGNGTLTLAGTEHNNLYQWTVENGTLELAKSTSLYAVDRPLTINGGTVILTGAGNNQINNATDVTVNGGTFDLNGKGEAIGGLNAAAAGGIVTNGNATAATLYVGGSTGGTSTGSFAGTIQNGAGVLNLTKEGTGTQTLTGTLAYSGNTTVSAGTLSVSSASLSNTGTVTIGSTAVLDLNHSGTDTVAALTIGVDVKGPGTYGSTASGATFPDDVHFSGNGKLLVAAPSGYTSWAGSNAGNQSPSQDFDNDGLSNGIEYFMNASAGFTANPGIISNMITWPNGGNIPSSAYGTQFVVQTSPNLVNWTPVPVGSLTTNTNSSLQYTLPTGAGKLFVRLVVTPN